MKMNTESEMKCAIKNVFGDKAVTTFTEMDSGADILRRCVKEGNEDFVASCFNSQEAYDKFVKGETSMDRALTSFSLEIDGESSITLDFDEPVVPQIRAELKAMADDDIVKFVISGKMVVGAVE